MELQVIAYASNGFEDKFGIPRQSREDSLSETRIIFEAPFRVREALRGIEGYSHLWLIWGFSQVPDRTWSPTVRPPRLGGNTRMGVFATRSPYRPNRLGLSSVRLLRVEETHEGCVLVVSGADMLNGTPIYDIKPYLSFSDSHPDAVNGFAEATRDYALSVHWGEQEGSMPEDVKKELEQILSQDPRPSYQTDDQRVYQLDYAGYHISFRVDADGLHVLQSFALKEK